jgi:LuxR family maltose regulon positive regulatory protein
MRFWAYFIAALQMLDAEIGRNALALMRTPALPPMEAILTILLNEIAAFPDNFAIVLDDYHVIDAKPIDTALTFLLDHLPPQMHLVITTREDPNLPLARLRARDQLTELRAADLRFTPAEAADFLNRVMSLNLSVEDIDTLETRTEGWIAGLQLAALSTRGREDVPGFIRAFTGDNRYIVDYLVEEVLQHQPEHVRSFLLQTSILDWLSGPLCDAVSDQEESHLLLEDLERGNLFVFR